MKQRRFIFYFFLVFITVVAQSMAHPGWGIVRDSKGNIFFVDVGRNIVWKIDTKGSVLKFVSQKHSHELFIDERDNIYGVHVEYDQRNDRWLSHRWKASPDGRISRLGPQESKHLFEHTDSRGNTYHFSSDAHKKFARVHKVNPAGDTIHFAGGTWGDRDGKGFEAQFRNFGPAAWDGDSALIFGSGGILRRLTLDGAVTTLAGRDHGLGDPDEPRASGILGIACSNDGSVYAANWEKNVVLRIGRDGTVSRFHYSSMGWSPVGILVSRDTVFVLEDRMGLSELLRKAGFGGPRVQRISPEGLITLVGTAK